MFAFGFVIPQIINIYFRSLGGQRKLPDYLVVIQYFNYSICGATQFFFMTLEYAEIQHSGFDEYFQSGWNLIDSSQSILYLLQNGFKFMRMGSTDPHSPAQFWYDLLSIVVLVQSSLKFL